MRYKNHYSRKGLKNEIIVTTLYHIRSTKFHLLVRGDVHTQLTMKNLLLAVCGWVGFGFLLWHKCIVEGFSKFVLNK